MTYYSELASHIRDKVKVTWNLSNYTTRKNQTMLQVLMYLIQLHKKNFIPLKAEIDKVDFNKLVNVPTSLNDLKTKVHDLNVSKWKTLPIDLKKLSDVVDNDFVQNIKFNTLQRKVNSLENKIPDTTTLININQYNKNKEN